MRWAPLGFVLALALSCGREPGVNLGKTHLPDPEAVARSGRRRLRRLVIYRGLYEKRGYRFIFSDGGRPNRSAWLLLERAGELAWDGLAPPKGLPKAESLALATTRTWARGNASQVVEACISLDTALISLFFELARAMGIPRERLPGLLDTLALEPELALALLEPQNYHYSILRRSLAYYSSLKPWRKIPLEVLKPYGGKIEPGDTGRAVALIQERLAGEGYYRGPLNGIMDSATVQAIRDFQATHLLTPDGVVGPATVREMNVPLGVRIRAIKRGLRFWREIPARWEEDLWFMVNIPEFTLEVYQGQSLLRRHRVCVGKNDRDTNYTPTLRSRITQIVINPKWRVPDRIFEEEILEDIYEAGDLDAYMQKHGYRPVLQRGGKLRIVQQGGDRGALGRVKFLFPNRYGIYLHDTPQKKYFSLTRRAVSHGCVRVQGALDLARWILTTREGWTEERWKEALSAKDRKGELKESWVALRHPIPLYIVYVLTSVDTLRGRVVFLPDIYRGYGGKREVY